MECGREVVILAENGHEQLCGSKSRDADSFSYIYSFVHAVPGLETWISVLARLS